MLLLGYGSRSMSLFHVVKQGRTLVKIHVSSTVVEHIDLHLEAVLVVIEIRTGSLSARYLPRSTGIQRSR